MIEHFFIVGAQRCGTTYLYTVLDEHPQIDMAKPTRPEPKFFLKPDFADYTHADYERTFFDDQANVRIRGEKSTSYLEYEHAAQRIAQWYPQAKIIALLRDPITRAISNFQFSVNNGLETLSFEQAIYSEEQRRADYDRQQISASPFAYLKRGLYIDYLRVYARYFPPEQLKVLIYEEFVSNSADITQLYRYLDVTEDFAPPSLNVHINTSDAVTASQRQINPELESYMRDYFREANQQLEAFLGRPLTFWTR